MSEYSKKHKVRLLVDTYDHNAGEVVEADYLTAHAWVKAHQAEFVVAAPKRAKAAPKNMAKVAPENKAKEPEVEE